MSKSTREALEDLARKFSAEVLATIQAMSLAEVLDLQSVTRPTRSAEVRVAKAPSRAKRSSGDLDSVMKRIEDLLTVQPGLRAEEIRAHLGLTRKDIDGPILRALGAGRLRKTGARRGTRYFAR